MTTITYRDGVSIGGIIIYIPILILAIFLAIRHGFGRSSGWVYLVIFSLARIIGFSFQLATKNNPTSISAFEGYAILLSVGLSPLLLATLGLLSRVVSNTNQTKHTSIQPTHLKFIQIFVIVGLVLGIVGGTSSFDAATNTFMPRTESKAGVGIFVAAYVLIVVATLLTLRNISGATDGERRLLICIVISLVFLFVRLLYSILSTLAGISTFNLLTGNETVLLVMELIMELIVVLIYEGIGMTLKKAPRNAVGQGGDARMQDRETAYDGNGNKMEGDEARGDHGNKQGHFSKNSTLVRMGKKTIIGMVTSRVKGLL